MSLSPVSLYSAVTLASGASPTSPVAGTQLLPISINSIVGNAIAFNFIIATGSAPCGPNANIQFKYAWASTSYTAANTPNILGNITTINLTVPNTASGIFDHTTLAVPVLGNYFYSWLDIQHFQNPLTSGFSASAIPVAISSIIYDP